MIFGKNTTSKDNTAEIRKFLPNINATYEYEKLKNFLTNSYSRYIIPILGDDLSAKLDTFYATGVIPDEESISGSGSGSSGNVSVWTDLLEKCQYALINLAVFHGYHLLNIKIGDKGTHATESQDTRGLYKYEETRFLQSLKTEGYNMIDSILEHLELNVSHFPDWVDTEAYTIQKKYFLKNSREFTKEYPRVNNSRLVYLTLLPYMEMTEDFEIVPVISRAYFEELKTQVLNNSLTDDNKKILNYLKKAIAFYTIAKGFDNLNVNIYDNGVYFETTASNTASNDVTTNIMAESLQSLQAKALANAKHYCDYVLEIMNNSEVTQYLTYKASDAYHDGTITRTFNNTDKKIIRV